MPSKSFSVIFKKKITQFNKTISVDSDKSISQRSFIIGSICEGVSKVKNVLESQDIYSTINCLQKLNCQIKRIRKGEYKIFGKGLGSYYCKKNTVLNFGNSGTAARLLGFGVCSTNPNLQIKITGDKSLRNRSMYKIMKAVENFGVIFLPKNKFKLPITLISSSSPIGFKFRNDLSSQIKSAIMLGAINSFGKTEVIETKKSRDHTEKMLEHNSNLIKIKKGKENLIKITGKEILKPFNLFVPGDPSSASFYTALCLMSKNSKVVIKKVHINPTRVGFFNLVKKSNGKIFFKNKKYIGNELTADIHIRSSKLRPLKVDKKFFVSCQDEFPLMFAMASLLPGKSVFKGIGDLVNKESNRIKEMGKILKQIGIQFSASKNQMVINGNPKLNRSNKKIIVSGIYDHRILMSASVISLITGIKSKLSNFEQVATSCPNFLYTIKKLGGKFEKKN